MRTTSTRLWFLASLTIGLMVTAHGQVLYTAANALPPYGVYTCSMRGNFDVPGLSFPTSGTGVTWNFNSIAWGAPDSEVFYVQPSSWTYPASQFPESNVCVFQLGPGGEGWYNYYDMQADSIMHIGDASYQEDVTFVTFDVCPDPKVMARFPTAMGDQVHWPAYTCGISPTVRTYRREYLARGTLNVSGTSLANAVLARETTTSNSDTTRSYVWLAPNNLLRPVMRYYESGGLFWTNCTAGAMSVAEDGMRFIRAYPNPAAEKVSIQLNPAPETSVLELYDAQGSLMRSLPLAPGQTRLELDVQPLVPGVYHCLRRTGTLLAAQRLVVMR